MNKTVITKAEFEKRCEIEFEYLVWIDRLPKQKASQQAFETISAEYEVR